jgi:hypothetical protein
VRERRLPDATRVLGLFTIAGAAWYTAAILRFSWTQSFFVGDDYSAFYMAATEPLGKALLSPLGSKIVPLHRALTFLTWRVLPMNFALALAVLVSFHVLAAWFLYRTLGLVRKSRLNAVFVAFYATYVFVGVNLTWYSSGMTRFPYIALCLVAIHEYLLFSQTGRRRRLVAVVFCYLLALGFYSKAIFLPLYCAGLDLSRDRRGEEKDPRRERAKWATLAALVALGAVYVPIARSLLDEASRQTNTNVPFLFAFVKSAGAVFGYSLVDVVVGLRDFAPVALVVLAVVAYSTLRARRSLAAWAALAAVLCANFLIVGASNRTVLWGGLMVFEYRHYFELCFLTTLFVAIVVHRVREGAPELRVFERSTRARAAAALGIGALFVVHAVFSYRAFYRIQASPSGDMQQSRRYMRTLIADLDRLGPLVRPGVRFADGYIPRYLDQMAMDFTQKSQLFAAMAVPAVFVPAAQATYKVGSDGHVFRLARSRRR